MNSSAHQIDPVPVVPPDVDDTALRVAALSIFAPLIPPSPPSIAPTEASNSNQPTLSKVPMLHLAVQEKAAIATNNVPPPISTLRNGGPSTVPRKVVALSGFQRFSSAHLKLKRGNIVTVLHEREDGWVEGETNGRRGIFPKYKLTELPDLNAAVDKGDATAQLELGVRLHFGYGMRKDLAEAARYYRLAAEKGEARGQYNLGMSYGRGSGVTKNDAESLSWFRKAAEQGNVGAQFSIGRYYHDGRGVEKNTNEAVVWLRKAAEQGFSRAQYYLGDCYATGSGVRRDDAEAARLYALAAEQGLVGAQSTLGWCFDNGVGVPTDKVEAVKWYRKASEQGDVVAQFNLGVCLQQGIGVPMNVDESAYWYLKAAEVGDGDARCALAKYFSGLVLVRIP